MISHQIRWISLICHLGGYMIIMHKIVFSVDNPAEIRLFLNQQKGILKMRPLIKKATIILYLIPLLPYFQDFS